MFREPDVVSFRPGAVLPPLRPRRQAVFLVHGYAVSQEGACRSYRTFQQRLREAASHMDLDVVWVHWPGDAGLPVVSQLAYPWKVNSVGEIAPRLAAVLRRQAGENERSHCRIALVGHSLGCRLILTALNQKAPGEPEVKPWLVLLMAAAVPSWEVAPGGALAGCRDHLGRSVVLYSPHDWVLRMPFWAGQLLGRGEVFPEAIGTFGQPRLAWDRASQMQRFGHNDYWKSPWTARTVARELGNVLSSPEPPRPEFPLRSLATWAGPTPRPGLAARMVGKIRRLTGL